MQIIIIVHFLSSDETDPRTLLIDEVEVGKRYEIAITTTAGFYRYRMGDVLEVVDFHEKCPVVQVKYRSVWFKLSLWNVPAE